MINVKTKCFSKLDLWFWSKLTWCLSNLGEHVANLLLTSGNDCSDNEYGDFKTIRVISYLFKLLNSFRNPFSPLNPFIGMTFTFVHRVSTRPGICILGITHLYARNYLNNKRTFKFETVWLLLANLKPTVGKNVNKFIFILCTLV